MSNEDGQGQGGTKQATAGSALPPGDRQCRACGGGGAFAVVVNGATLQETCGACLGTGAEPGGCDADEHLRVGPARPITKAERAASELAALLGQEATDLPQIKAAEWEIESNGYHTYFRHQSTRQVFGMPRWAVNLIAQSSETAAESVRRNLRDAIGCAASSEAEGRTNK